MEPVNSGSYGLDRGTCYIKPSFKVKKDGSYRDSENLVAGEYNL